MSAPSTDKAAVIRIMWALKKAGVRPVKLWACGNELCNVTGMGERALLLRMFTSDNDVIEFMRNDEHLIVWFVYGNDPEEVVADWSPCDSLLGSIVENEIESWWP